MNKPSEIKMNHHIDPLSFAGTLLFYVLGIVQTFQSTIVILVGLTTLLYNVFKFLKENFPAAYTRIMNLFK